MKIRLFTAVLFFTGIVWALFAWILIFAPIGIFIDSYNFQNKDIFISCFGSIQAIIGYFLWFQWGYFTFRKRFYKISFAKVWLLSFINHFLWFIYFLTIKENDLLDFIFNTKNLLLIVWITLNLIISIYFLILSFTKKID